LLSYHSCNDFEELNSNPTKSVTVNPNSQLAYSLLWTFGNCQVWEIGNEYCGAFSQHVQGNWSVTNYGGQYRKGNNQFSDLWSRLYSQGLKNTIDGIANSGGKPHLQNVHSALRIVRVYYSMMLTDIYGDIPYFDAGKGYIEGITNPVYDKQETIYKDFLRELEEAGAAFNDQGGTLSGDIIYKNNLLKWKKLANSLRLRAAMRLIKIEPQLTHEEVKNILASETGVFSSSGDDALVKYMNINDYDYDEPRRNGLSQVWRGRDAFPAAYICASLWNHLKTTEDPRMLRIGRCYNEDSPHDPFNRTDLTEEIIGEVGIDGIEPVLPGFFNWDNFPGGYQSQILGRYVTNPQCRPQMSNAFLHGDTPGILFSYAETQLLLSEAKARWTDLAGTETAEQYYINGVAAAMKLLNDYYPIHKTITAGEINTFLEYNSFPGTLERRLKVINEQLWVLHITNPYEAYANWRRSGYPVLKPASEYGALTIDSQEIPRRFSYPLFEMAYNKAGYEEAIARMGNDSWNNRVWWDRE
jgi:hypothetical protein